MTTHNPGARRVCRAMLAAGVAALPLLSGCSRPTEKAAPGPAPAPNRSATVAPNPAAPASNPAPTANAAVLAGWKLTPKQYISAPNNPPLVALTFDAGADGKATTAILKVLADHNVHATFFLTGKFCEKFPKECRAIADAGMELGNHSYSHPHFTKISDQAIRDQLTRGEAAIVKACGRGAKPLFRFPYGDSNRHTCEVVAQAGYQSIYWSLDSLDAFGKPKSADFVVDRITHKIKRGAVTLMHVSSPGSADALPRIFDHLDKMGAKVVPVSVLMLDKSSASASSKVASARQNAH
jgi:peptidoglycan/xylan/chitin deacetylase (PgdA/CDA1 family)